MAQSSKTADLPWVPPQAYFVVSAIFHYLGPAFAVLLFAQVGVLGVAWLRIASAAAVFAVWRRPWRLFGESSWTQRRLLLAPWVGLVLMKVALHPSISILPLA